MIMDKELGLRASAFLAGLVVSLREKGYKARAFYGDNKIVINSHYVSITVAEEHHCRNRKHIDKLYYVIAPNRYEMKVHKKAYPEPKDGFDIDVAAKRVDEFCKAMQVHIDADINTDTYMSSVYTKLTGKESPSRNIVIWNRIYARMITGIGIVIETTLPCGLPTDAVADVMTRIDDIIDEVSKVYALDTDGKGVE